MRVLVTGGAGFIGSHVCDALLARGHEVLALDDLSSGKPENLDPRARLIVADVRTAEAARRAATKKIVFSSTGGAIYGEQEVHPAPETHPLRPVSPYGCAKASGELYLGYYYCQYGLECVA